VDERQVEERVRCQTCDENSVPDSSRFELHNFYDSFRKFAEMVLSSLPVDDSLSTLVDDRSSTPVDDTPVTTEAHRDLILSALEMIREEQHDTEYNATVDEVLDKVLNNATQTFRWSARDVYSAIFTPDGPRGSRRSIDEGHEVRCPS
jgi:hypothetical protein